MKVISEFRNDLLKRNEIEISKDYESNPGFSKVLEELSAYFKVDENTIVVRKVGSHFGRNKFFVDCFVYDSLKDKEKTEPKKNEMKKAGGSG